MKKLIVVLLVFVCGCTTGAMWEDMAPSAVGSDMEDGATDVDPNTASFSVTFVKAVDVSTVTTSTFFLVEVGGQASVVTLSGAKSPGYSWDSSSPATLLGGLLQNDNRGAKSYDSSICDQSKAIQGTVNCTSDTECTFYPSSPLDSGIQFAICLTGIVYKDRNILPPKMIMFTTATTAEAGEEDDVVPPTITDVTPADGATNVAVNTTVKATFSEAMKSSTITTDTFTLSGVTGAVTYDSTNKIATFTPDGLLANETIYTATLSGEIKDAAGNSLPAYSWSFTTSAGIIAPTVTSVNPASGATNVPLGELFSAVFSVDMDATTINTTNITVTGSIVGAISGTVSYNSGTKTATFTPSSLSANLEVYTVTVGTGVKDTSGTGLASSFSWSFTTKQYTTSLFYQKYGVWPYDEFGISVGGLGDLNGDGTPDFIVGAAWATGPDPDYLSYVGSVSVFSGADGTLFYQKYGEAAVYFLGASVDGAGDVNGDGTPDFIVGASMPWTCGAVFMCAGDVVSHAYVYSGLDGSELWQWVAGTDRFGVSVAGLGDVNGDGRADLVVGAWAADPGGLADAGSAYVYSGADGSLLYQVNGEAAGDSFGLSLDRVGDVNGDGTPDFIVGAWAADPGGLADAGRVYIYSGADGTELPYSPLNGEAAGDSFGVSVDGAGDVNRDGTPDFIVGAFYADPDGLAGAGSAYVFSGVNGSLLYRIDGGEAGGNLGVSVGGPGDVDGDGYDDFIVGAWFTSPGGLANAGSAYVYSGRDGILLTQVNGDAADDCFGVSVGGVGDVNGDGRADFIVGAWYPDIPGGEADVGSASVYISE